MHQAPPLHGLAPDALALNREGLAQTEVDARSIFAQRLKQAREDAGLTQKELGMTIGLPQETAAVRINSYEKAVHDADLATARRIAEALGVPLAFLYAETDTMCHLPVNQCQTKLEVAGSFWIRNSLGVKPPRLSWGISAL